MEHCLAPFLDICDANKDRKISLHEWGGCLGLDQGIVHSFIVKDGYLDASSLFKTIIGLVIWLPGSVKTFD